MRRFLLIDAPLLPAFLLTTALVVAGCAPAPAPPSPTVAPEAAETSTDVPRHVLPLPPGAELDPAAGEPEDPFTPTELDWEGSLSPHGPGAFTEDGEPAPTPNVDRIRKRGRLIVGIDQSLYLLAFRDTASGELQGFEVDLAREIAKDIFADEGEGPSAGRVDFRFVDSAARSELLRQNQVDIVIRTMSITPDRAEVIAFSTPYLTSRVRMLAPRDRGIASLEGLPGKTVCIVDGTNLLQQARTYAPDSDILRTRTWSDCLMATQQFQADAIFADDAILAGIAAQDPYVDILPGALATQHYGVGLPKHHDDMVRQVNATLERVRSDGTWRQLYSTWLSGSIEQTQPPPLMYREED